MILSEIAIGALALLVALVVISFILEALRPAPNGPAKLVWAPGIPIQYADIGGIKVRYIKTGAGPDLVLLHTLRTRLDLFEKVVSDLAKSFTVYALDYPGHGYSDIPKAQYDADFFVHSVERFLDVLDLRAVTLCGVSIGGAVALIVAGRRNARVARVVPINPYDYAKGRGMIHLRVRDLNAAVIWFEKVLQLLPGFRNERMATFSFNSMTLIFGAAGDDVSATVGFESDNCDRDFKAVVERGAVVLEPPTDKEWGVRTAYFKGPGDLKFEIEGPIANR